MVLLEGQDVGSSGMPGGVSGYFGLGIDPVNGSVLPPDCSRCSFSGKGSQSKGSGWFFFC